MILDETTQENQEDEVNQINQRNLRPFGIIENDFFGIQLTPGVYELVDINNAIEKKLLKMIMILKLTSKQIQYQ